MRTKTELMQNLAELKARIAAEYFDDAGFIGLRGWLRLGGTIFTFVASNGEGWEHVSVSTNFRCPTWNEMHFFKQIFWAANECVIQFHPPEDNYVNNHPYCLHLWKPIGIEIPQPPTSLVGIRQVNTEVLEEPK